MKGKEETEVALNEDNENISKNTDVLRGKEEAEVTLSDSGSYALLNTIRFQASLRAQDPAEAIPGGAQLQDYELAMLGPAHAVCFQSCSLKICGVQVELLEAWMLQTCLNLLLQEVKSNALVQLH